MNVSRREFFAFLGTGAAAAALPGCCCPPPPKCGPKRAKCALQLYSIREYIGGKRLPRKPGQPHGGLWDGSGVGLDKAFEDVAAIGYKAVEFAGYYQYADDPKGLKKALANAGIVACGTHVGTSACGFDASKGAAYDAEVLKKTCAFNMTYGNNLIICPGGGNFPAKGQDLDEFLKRLVDFYNRAAADAAKFGCRIGLHNHQKEFTLKMKDGVSYWDYFFTNTDPAVCMEQDVGWTTCAGADPKVQYARYPHRSPTLHAKENGMGKDVKTFDAILGKPGQPGATPVDWDGLVPVTEKDGVEWYVVECERHCDDLSAVLPSYTFLRSKGLN